MSDEEMLTGYRIDLPDNRHVWVAKREADYCIEFCNSEGQKTNLRLSLEAGDALRHLLRADGITAADEIKSYLFQVSMTKKVDQMMAWTLLKTDTAPVVGADG